MPGLDGLRAIAVSAVVAYHVGASWAPGGLLGVGIFFTLSGYLITDLLLGQSTGTRLRIGDFWIRRARRLLPALFVMLVVVGVWASISRASQLGTVRGQEFAATLYISNWWQIFQHVSYFGRFGPPTPLNHLWSLAIEEQFYLLWPWLLWAALRWLPERETVVGLRPRLAIAILVLAIVSSIEMAVLYHPSFDPSRVYDGTDTRAFGLLFGAALAAVWPSQRLPRRITPRAKRLLETAGVMGLVTIALLVIGTNQYSGFLYRGGLVLLSISTVMVVAAAASPATNVGRYLGVKPLKWLGERSYAIYLWHVPVIVLTNPILATGVSFPRTALQVGGTLALAELSWRFVEQPVRSGAFGAIWRHARAVGWRDTTVPRQARIALVVGACSVLLVCIALTGVGPSTGTSLAASVSGSSAHHSGNSSTIHYSFPVGPTSCHAVVHIGDSTSEGLVSSNYLPNPRRRLAAQYGRVGVAVDHFEIQGATSIVETLPGETNAYDVARQLTSQGYHGCWVVALGTNDAADVYVGSSVSLDARIQRMMSVIKTDPVMWVDAKSLVPSGPYSELDMQGWNTALLAACSRYPNMRVFDWASVAQDSWYIPDGIHFTSQGYAERGKLIANALARAFPRSGTNPQPGCLVTAAEVVRPPPVRLKQPTLTPSGGLTSAPATASTATSMSIPAATTSTSAQP
jgi:peptidoglycan/LPS O-acetylase OafA/YrhL